MPIRVESLYWEVAADTRRFVNGIAGAGTLMQRFTGLISGPGAALTALGVTMGLVAGKAIAMAAALDKEMQSVGTVIENTGERLNELKRQILDLSTSMPDTPVALTRGLYDIVQAGILDTVDAMTVLTASEKFAVGAITDLNTAADSVTGVLNAYRMEASEATKVTDIMFQTVRLGKVRGEELARALGNVTTSAAIGKVSLEELGAAIATLTLFNLTAEESTLALNRLILNIVSPSRQTAKAARELGIEWNGAALQAKGFTKFMADVEEKTGGNIVKLQKLMPNIRSARAGFILASQGASEYRRILGEMNTSSGSTEVAFRKMMNTAQNQAALLKNQLNVEWTKLGQTILPTVISFMTAMNNALSTDNQALIRNLERMGVSLETIAKFKAQSTIVDLVNDLKRLRDELNDVQAGPATSLTFGMSREQIVARRDSITLQAAEAAQRLTALYQTQDKVRRGELQMSEEEKSITEDAIKQQQFIIENLGRTNTEYTKTIDLLDQIAEKTQQINDLGLGIHERRFPPQPPTSPNPPDTDAAAARIRQQQQALRDELMRSIMSAYGTAGEMAQLQLDDMEKKAHEVFGRTIPEDVRQSLEIIKRYVQSILTGEVVTSWADAVEQAIHLDQQRLAVGDSLTTAPGAEVDSMRIIRAEREGYIAQLEQQRATVAGNAAAVADLNKRILEQRAEIDRLTISINTNTEVQSAAIQDVERWIEDQDLSNELRAIGNAAVDTETQKIADQITVRQQALERLIREREANRDNARAVALYDEEIRKLQRDIARLTMTTPRGQKPADEMREAVKQARELGQKIRENVTGAVDLANGLGLINDRFSSLIRQAATLGEMIVRMKAGDTSAILPGIGAAVGIIGAVFGGGPDPIEERRAEVAKENTQAIYELTRVIGEWQKNITGTAFEKTYEAAADALRRAQAGGAGNIAFDLIYLPQALKAAGISMQELIAVAKELGISFAGSVPTMDEIKQLLDAMGKTELTQQFGTLQGAFEGLQRTWTLFNITDPVKQLQMLADAVLNLTTPTSDLYKILTSGLDLSSAAGREKLKQMLTDLWMRSQQSGLTPEQIGNILGGMTPQELFQVIDELTKAMNTVSEATGIGTTNDITVSRQITEVSAGRMISLLTTIAYRLESIDVSTASLAGRAPGPATSPEQTSADFAAAIQTATGSLMGYTPGAAPAIMAPPAPDSLAGASGWAVQIDELTITVTSPSGDPQAIGAGVADGFIMELSQQLRQQVRVRSRAQGDISL